MFEQVASIIEDIFLVHQVPSSMDDFMVDAIVKYVDLDSLLYVCVRFKEQRVARDDGKDKKSII